MRSGFDAVGSWAAATLGIDDVSTRAWRLFEDGHRGDVFNRVLESAGLSRPDLVRTMVDVYRSHEPNIRLCEDADEFLHSITGRATLGAISDGPLASQQAKVTALGLGNRIPHVVLTSELGREFGKPNPRAFALVQQKAGAESAECVYIADNPGKDFVAPRALGWVTVRIKRKLSLHHDLPSGEDVDAEFEDCSGVARYLRLTV